ncbi:MAG: penicillin acylase family protein [Gemmatimonadaceae bacterium]
MTTWRRAALFAFAASIAALPRLADAQVRGQLYLDSAKARLSQLEGTVIILGLDSVVEVIRDTWGVPHIYAKTQHDLFVAQGYVAAQDRLWQMEMARREGEGRLAEVLGAGAVERDRMARLLKYRGDMDAEWNAYGPGTKEIVHSFVQGVNAYINQVQASPPVEFMIQGIRPEPWSDDVPLQRLAALAMTGNAQSEVKKARLVKLMGSDLVEKLWPTDPYRHLDPAPNLDLGGIDAKSLGPLTEAYGTPAYSRLEGSNNWVVSGARTLSGRPLLANDPHRTIGVPSLRYVTHLSAPGWNVIGAGEPGLPGVAAGHNARIAWGFTIVGMDQQDVYVEQVRPCDATAKRRYSLAADARCYLSGRQWKPVRVINEPVRVRNEATRTLKLEFTEHGPLVGEDEARGRAFALKFVGEEPGTAGYLASLSIDRATDWAGFLAAAARWRLPTENLVYADVDGNIGWVAAGLMPVRHWSGLLPVPGEGGYEWRGFLPFDELPKSFNPPSGMIVTANNNILPPGYSHPLNYEWARPDRAHRITELLQQMSSARKLQPADFAAIQLDEYSLLASKLVPIIVAAAEARGQAARWDVQTLARWNYVVSKDSVAPLLFEVWLNAAGKRVFEPRVTAFGGSFNETGFDVETLMRLLAKPDAVFGAGARAESGRDNTVLFALDDAVAEISRRLSTDRRRWSWGALHKALFRHPLVEAFDLEEVPRGGDANTVNATGGANYLQRSGASYREILDLGNWDNSMAINVPGQSGQPLSPYFENLLPLWASGQYFPLAFSRARVEQARAHVLVLQPTK